MIPCGDYGNVLDSIAIKPAVAQKQKVIGLLEELFGDDVSIDMSWITIESDEILMGLGHSETTDRLFMVPME